MRKLIEDNLDAKINDLKQMINDMYSEGILIIPNENNAKKWFKMRIDELLKRIDEK